MIDENPVLAVSTIGRGKIIWIGFNFLMHINQFLNKDEGKMINNIIEWACGRPPRIEITSFEKRPYGYVDAVINVNSSKPFWLLISETYYPGWRIYINQRPAEIYMAEPKLMIIRVEANVNNNIHISLRYGMTEIHILGIAVSILFVSLTMVLIVRGAFKTHT